MLVINMIVRRLKLKSGKSGLGQITKEPPRASATKTPKRRLFGVFFCFFGHFLSHKTNQKAFLWVSW